MKWKVGPVQDTYDSRHAFSGSGFNIDEHGKPLVTFGYGDPAKAREAAKLITQALAEARLVTVHA